MQRTMFSGGSSPSTSAHRRKKRHGIRSFRPKKDISAYRRSRDLGTHLEPDEDEIPKADHGELGGCHAAPRMRVLNRDDVHDVYEHFHREQRDEKPDCVSSRRPRYDIFWA